MKKINIWSSEVNLDEWKEYLLEEYPEMDVNDEYIFEKASELNYEQLEDERLNLSDIFFNGNIIIIANLGLWNGRVPAYKMLGHYASDCLYGGSDDEFVEWYIDSYGNLRANASHHDGENHYLYRVFKDNISDYQIENFKEKIIAGCLTSRDISRYTKSVGKVIAKFYGL